MQKNFKKILVRLATVTGFIFVCFFLVVLAVKSADIEEIKDKIEQKSGDIKKLEQEIVEYQKSLDVVSTQAQSLKKDITTLTITKKKLDTDIKLTQANISDTNFSIDRLATEIHKKEGEIDQNIRVLKETIQNIRVQTEEGPIIHLLRGENISDYLETSQNFEERVGQEIADLRDLKSQLQSKKDQAEGKKKTLSNLKTELGGKKQAVAQTEQEKNNLLKVTKNQEASYTKLLAEKKRLKEAFEKELFAYESELKIAIDPSKLPTVAKGVISWPLDNVRITQYFGATVAAKKLYVSGSHNGVDFGASIGTPVKSVLGGVISGTGNTDLKSGCYSYGKWIVVKHPNGLSSLYGHLSSVVVSTGQNVSIGDVIGYSGKTGYSTGPHLHLTILATEGVRIMPIPVGKAVNCVGVTIPIADTKAFLDPMLYLPK